MLKFFKIKKKKNKEFTGNSTNLHCLQRDDNKLWLERWASVSCCCCFFSNFRILFLLLIYLYALFFFRFVSFVGLNLCRSHFGCFFFMQKSMMHCGKICTGSRFIIKFCFSVARILTKHEENKKKNLLIYFKSREISLSITKKKKHQQLQQHLSAVYFYIFCR